MTHEITMEKQELEEKPKKNLTFKPCIIKDEEKEDDKEEENDDDDDDYEVKEDIAFITKTIPKLSKKKTRE
jgi:hypothetical protein